MKPLQHLNKLSEQDARERNALRSVPLPDFAVTWNKYKQSSANEIEKAVCAWVNLNGGFFSRITNQGVMRNGKLTPSTTINGFPDCCGSIMGRFVGVEVKYGKDRQSADQKRCEQLIVDSNGYYFIAKSFDSFYVWYNSKLKL